MAEQSNLLSPEELAALAEGIDDGSIAVDTGFNLTTRVKKHDLASEDSTLGVNTSALEMINERFVRLFRLGLMEILRTSPRITPSRAQIVRFGDYLRDLRPPLSVNTIRINPLRGFSLAVIDTVTGEYEYLLNKDVNFIRQAYPSPTATGKPRYYALFGSRLNDPNELTFILGPSPDANYGAELHYFYYPESIVTAGTSWLGDNYSPVLLYGSLVEAYTYMKGETDMLAVYQTKYNEALQQLNRLGTGLERGDSYRDGQAKIKVNP
jgi:hypothetical protein